MHADWLSREPAPLVKNNDLFVPFIQNNLSKSRLTCFSASVNECILVRRSILKIDPRKHGSQFSLVGDGVNYSSLTRLFSESVLTNKQFVLNMALSKQVSEFSTPSNEFEVESCTLTIRTKLPVFVDHVRPCHTLPTLIKRYKKPTLSWLSYCIKLLKLINNSLRKYKGN